MLALGVDGGFRTDEQKHDIVKHHRLVVIKEGGTEGFSVKFPDEVREESFLVDVVNSVTPNSFCRCNRPLCFFQSPWSHSRFLPPVLYTAMYGGIQRYLPPSAQKHLAR